MKNKLDKALTLKTLQTLQRDATAMFENIEWNFGALIGATMPIKQRQEKNSSIVAAD